MKPKTKGHIFVSEIKECLSEEEREAVIQSEFMDCYQKFLDPVKFSAHYQIDKFFFKAGFLAGQKGVEFKKKLKHFPRNKT